jgi:hypothetical protein
LEGKDDLVTLSALTDQISMYPAQGLRLEVARLLEEDAKLMTRIVDLMEKVEAKGDVPSDGASDLHSLVLLARASRGLKILLAGRLRRGQSMDGGEPLGETPLR